MVKARRADPAPGIEGAITSILRARYRQDVLPVHEPEITGDIRPDFVGRLADGSLVIVEALQRGATVHDVVRLAGLGRVIEAYWNKRNLAKPRSRTPPLHRNELLLMAPSFSRQAGKVALVSGVTTHTVERLAIREPERRPWHEPSRHPLTTETSWRILLELITKRRFPTIRALSTSADVSYGWAHSIVTYLMHLQVVRSEGNAIEVTHLPRLLDYIGMERPMRSMRAFRVPVASGLSPHVLLRGLQEVFPQVGEPILAGLSAASARGSALETPRILQVYVEVPKAVLSAILQSRALRDFGEGMGRVMQLSAEDDEGRLSPEATLEAFFPDREVSHDSESLSKVRVVSFGQTILDCAGLGSTGHRAVQELVKAHADGP